MDRREFVQKTALVSAIGPFIRTRPRSQKYRVGLIGSGWWGINILRTALATGTSDAVALCDVDETHLQQARDEITQLTGSRPAVYSDHEELLSEQNCDIVIIATPDHWHALGAIAAINAGAHVFLEKPISHTIDEGKAILKGPKSVLL